MSFKFLVTLGLAVAFSTPSISWADPLGGPHLWLSTDSATFDEGGTGYFENNSDPWITDSYLTNSNLFTLYIYNASKRGTATDIQLMLAVHAGENGFITVGGTTYTSFSDILLPSEYGGGSHGIYNDPLPNGHDGRYTLTTSLGNLSPLSSTSVDVTWSGFSQIHLDIFSSNGFYNPASHDATGGMKPVPEPGAFLLLGSGLIGIAIWRKRQSRGK